MKWKNQIVEEKMAEAKKITNDENQLLAFKAGLQQGILQLMATLHLHDKVELSNN